MTKQVALELIRRSEAAMVIGVDEVGYGAWAGPLVVCAVATPKDWTCPGLKDSKKLSHKARKSLVEGALKGLPQHIIFCHAARIDDLGLAEAWRRSVLEVIQGVHALLSQSSIVVVDGVAGGKIADVISLPKADSLVPAVSAASVVAKESRDTWMRDADEVFPGYGFKSHVGYGTKVHQESLSHLGPCPIHRQSYAPIKRVVEAMRIE